ncbi:hypothetical protein Fmac_005906 [Flemingia macrophylla]|uniref:Uncharacterized protein n=1 Tax=Flemingia macrophylla TaxID=520843 RepID=A0ABD1N947_9FABA
MEATIAQRTRNVEVGPEIVEDGKAGICCSENSYDSAIRSLDDQDVRVENQNNYSDENDNDDNSDHEIEDNALDLTECNVGNTSEIEGEIDQILSNRKLNSN